VTCSAARQAEEPLIAELEAEIAILKAQCEQMNKEQAAFTEASRIAKLQIMESGEQLGNLKSDIAGVRQDNARLSAVIVPDSERFKRELTTLGVTLDKERHATDEIERRGRELKAKTEAMAKLQKEVAKLQKLLEDTEVERTKLKDANRSMKEMQANIGKAEQKTHEAEQELVNLNKQLASMADKLQRLQKRHAAKREQASAALEEARAERSRFELEAQATRQKMEQNDAAVRMLQQRFQEKQSEYDGEMELVKERFEELEAQVRDYHRQMQIAMQPTR
jgi:kinetochore protein Nuf2